MSSKSASDTDTLQRVYRGDYGQIYLLCQPDMRLDCRYLGMNSRQFCRDQLQQALRELYLLVATWLISKTSPSISTELVLLCCFTVYGILFQTVSKEIAIVNKMGNLVPLWQTRKSDQSSTSYKLANSFSYFMWIFLVNLADVYSILFYHDIFLLKITYVCKIMNIWDGVSK